MNSNTTSAFIDHLTNELDKIRADGLMKTERRINSRQGSLIKVAGRDVINLCANNYLGLADHPELIAAGTKVMQTRGFGMASVRFICGTQDLHKELEEKLASFLGMEDCILYAACFDANGGLFEPLLTDEDAVVSDSLNHASIIDGIRLCKARRFRYRNNDMDDLEKCLDKARADKARHVMIATDGVFSMDGHLANLPEITRLAEKYDAQVMVDDCHATGFMGSRGAGTPDHSGVCVDILTGTLGKALGGAMGGYVAGPQPVIEMLRQRSRPYLFSNALPPVILAAGIRALEMISAGNELRTRLFANADYWRNGLAQLGFSLLPGEHPIVPVMLEEAELAQEFARQLFDFNVYVSGFFYPVVPLGKARIRTQMSAALGRHEIDLALAAFESVGNRLGVI